MRFCFVFLDLRLQVAKMPALFSNYRLCSLRKVEANTPERPEVLLPRSCPLALCLAPLLRICRRSLQILHESLEAGGSQLKGAKRRLASCQMPV